VTRILLVDDEPKIRRALAVNLEARGYEVIEAADGEAGVEAALDRVPDVILLDLGLPGIDGQEVIERIRTWSDVPIIVLSVRSSPHDKVAALDAGADDYVTKPFGIDELLARLRVVQRRHGPVTSTPIVRTRHFVLDLAAKHAEVGDDEVRLTPIEWGLVEQLVRTPGRLVGRRELLKAVWGPEYGSETNYLRVHMANLRRKLEPESSRPRYFVTEPGIGYRFAPDRDESPPASDGSPRRRPT
jgi:two-component system KDP operon response regulator KdpE